MSCTTARRRWGKPGDGPAVRPPRSGVATPGHPDVDEHRHWSVVEWGLAGPTAAVTVEAKKPNA